MVSGLVHTSSPLIRYPLLDDFSVIGDPGCDGLGAATMSIFAKALTINPGKLCIIAGDIVPCGVKQFYDHVSRFINIAAVNPVFTLCGNHDTNFFSDYFGRKDYAIADNRLLIVLLDNSKREFSRETLEFCTEMLRSNRQEHVMIMFHIPPPNPSTTNTINTTEWLKLRDVLQPHRQRIKYIVCGHVHSYVEQQIDGFPLIITGGGGARIEPVNPDIDIREIQHHIVRFVFESDGILRHHYIGLNDWHYESELRDEVLNGYLENAWKNECMAHIRYRIFADDALSRGMPGLAHQFRALSESEFYHARNHYFAMGRQNSLRRNMIESIENENYEITAMYKDYLDYAVSAGLPLAQYSFGNALEAEKVHHNLLRQSLNDYDAGVQVNDGNYYTCTSCGYSFKMEQPPTRCPICGAPADKIMPSL